MPKLKFIQSLPYVWLCGKVKNELNVSGEQFNISGFSRNGFFFEKSLTMPNTISELTTNECFARPKRKPLLKNIIKLRKFYLNLIIGRNIIAIVISLVFSVLGWTDPENRRKVLISEYSFNKINKTLNPYAKLSD